MTKLSNEGWRLLFSGIVGAILGAVISSSVTFISMRVQSESRKKEADRTRRLEVIDRYVRACNQVITQSARLDGLIASEYGLPLTTEGSVDFTRLSPHGKLVFLDIEKEVYPQLLEYKIQADIANITFGQEVADPIPIAGRLSKIDPYEHTKGSIGGTVADQNGAAIHGALVVVIGTEGERTEQETINGLFNVDDLVPATYIVTVSGKGFKTARVSKVEVLGGTQSVLNIKMEPGEVTAVIDVSGATDSYKDYLASRRVQSQAAEKKCDDTAKRMFDLLPK
jgi:hypothetical protein